MEYMIIFAMLFSIVLFCNLFRNKNGLPTNWPLVGMVPAFLKNIHRFNDFSIELMERSNLSFQFKGPWLANMHILMTADPTNVHHVLSAKFENFIKGSKLNEILAPLGDGILNTDSSVWLYHRNVAHTFFSHPNFHQFLINVTWKKVKSGLIPVLDHACKHNIEIDLQDLFSRFGYDTMCTIMMDHDPTSLSVHWPNFPLIKAVYYMSHGAFYRHTVPTWMWKLQRWLNVGKEKKMKQGCKTLDDFIYKCIARKRVEKGERASKAKDLQDIEVGADLLTLFMDKHNGNDKFLRDTIKNFFLAGGETTMTALTWFFYLVSKNPRVFHKIRDELKSVLSKVEVNDDMIVRNFKEVSSNLVYLHAALCETLRLYPSLVFDPKAPLEPQILPSGHQVNPDTQIIILMYPMGRLKSLWGDDCNEFKPERWISKTGMIKHEPSYKFAMFGAGPRACLGKQMAFTQMKVMVSMIIQKYHIEAIEKNDPVPSLSVILHMKNGFKVKVFHSQP